MEQLLEFLTLLLQGLQVSFSSAGLGKLTLDLVDVFLTICRFDEVAVASFKRWQHVQNHAHLVLLGAILSSWRERVAALAGEKRPRFVVVLLGTFLGELYQLVSNAPDTPDVYSVSILLFDENDLRCPKPPGADVT